MSEATSPLADPSNPNREWGYEVEAYTDFAAQAESRFRQSYAQQYGDDINWQEVRLVVKRVDYR